MVYRLAVHQSPHGGFGHYVHGRGPRRMSRAYENVAHFLLSISEF